MNNWVFSVSCNYKKEYCNKWSRTYIFAVQRRGHAEVQQILPNYCSKKLYQIVLSPTAYKMNLCALGYAPLPFISISANLMGGKNCISIFSFSILSLWMRLSIFINLESILFIFCEFPIHIIYAISLFFFQACYSSLILKKIASFLSNVLQSIFLHSRFKFLYGSIYHSFYSCSVLYLALREFPHLKQNFKNL